MNVPCFLEVIFINENEDTQETWDSPGQLNVSEVEAIEENEPGELTITTRTNEYCIREVYGLFCARFEAEYKRFSQYIIARN